MLLAVAPIPLLFAAVEWLGVNTLIADEFYYVDFIRLVRTGGDWTPWIWLQHNEHRVVPMKLLMVLLAGPTRWSQLAEMLCSAGLSALIVLILWRVYRSSGFSSDTPGLLAFAPVAWLVCSLSQYENQFFGMMVCHYFTALGVVVSLWLLARNGWISLVLAVLAAVLGAFSIVSGLLVFPAGIAVLVARRAGWGRWTAWCLGAVGAIGLYFRHYITPPHTQAFQWTLMGAYRIAKLGLATVGAPLAAGSVGWGITLGTLLLAASALLALRWLRAGPVHRGQGALAVGLLLFGLASSAMVAAGRAFMPAQNPLGSRYITYSTLAWIGAYFLLLGQAREGRYGAWKVAAWSLLVPGILAANLHGLAEALSWHDQRILDKYVLQTFALQSDAVLSRLGPPQSVRPAASYLSAERLSAFADPQQIVMLMDATNAKPTGEILRGQAVEQRLVCPVGKLHDIGVMILPAAWPGGSFVLTVTIGDRELARRSLETASIREWTWVQVPLDRPLPQCAGRDLVVRIQSPDTGSGSGVSVLANEPYYEGELRQAGTPIPGRRLGMALNAFHFGILH